MKVPGWLHLAILIPCLCAGNHSFAARIEPPPEFGVELKITLASIYFPPYFHQSEFKGVSGTAIETIRYLCDLSNMDCHFVNYPTARAYSNIEHGLVDALVTAKYARFFDCCSFSAWHFEFTSGILSELPLAEIPKNESELIGKELIMVRAWQSPYTAFPNLDKLVEKKQVQAFYANSIASSIRMFQKGRAPLLWGSDVFTWYFKRLAIPLEKINFKPLSVTPAGVWVSKKSPRHDEILRRLHWANQYAVSTRLLDQRGFLKPGLMKDLYQEAPSP